MNACADNLEGVDMTPYVELQKQIIEWLFQLQKNERLKLLELARACKTRDGPWAWWVDYLRSLGLNISPDEQWYREIRFAEVLSEQIDDHNGEIVIRNLLGMPLYQYGCEYGLEGWVKQRGGGQNRLRTPYCAQPGALKVGDILVTGEHVLDSPREGGNGAVLVHLSDGDYGVWLSFPSRTALALLPRNVKVPDGLLRSA